VASGPEKKGEEDDGLSNEARAMQQAAPYMNAVSKLIGGTLAGVLVGYLLGKHWHSQWPLVIGAVVGIGLGFYGFIGDLMRLGKKK
jgi:ATP synthase protein I